MHGNLFQPNASLELADQSVEDGCRSTDDILNLIQTCHLPSEQPMPNGSTATATDSAYSENSALTTQLDRPTSRSGMFEVFNKIGKRPVAADDPSACENKTDSELRVDPSIPQGNCPNGKF